MPVVVSPSAAQQNTLLVLWLSSMMFGLGMLLGAMSAKSLSLGTAPSNFILGLVVCTLACCFFRRPLEVAGDGARYFCTVFGEFKHGMPSNCLLFAASATVWIGGLKNN